MKTMMRTIKVLAVAGMTMGLALQAQAEDQIAPVWSQAENTAKAVLTGTSPNCTLTFYYDEDAHSSAKTYNVPDAAEKPADIPWLEVSNTVASVAFDESFADYRPKATRFWFQEFVVLKGIAGIENLNTSSVTNMGDMFYICPSLTSLDLSSFDTAKVTNMNAMFNKCSSLASLDVSSFNTAKVTSMISMFSNCPSLASLDVSSFDTANVTNMRGMFQNCSELVTIYASDAFKTNSVSVGTAMFTGCNNIVGGNGTTYSGPPTHQKAHIDVPGDPGYFTRGSTAITIADVTGATAKVYTNDTVEIAGPPYKVLVDATDVKVVYKAEDGYMFPGGYSTLTTNVTAKGAKMTVTLTAEQKPKPLPPVKVEVKAPAGATAAVYTNKVLVTGGEVVSNSIAYVVYTVSEKGKCFDNGETAVTNALDTASDPATDKSAYVPTSVGTPTVQLGVVAQRYPWNGTLDIEYKTPYYGASGDVTFYANGIELGTAQGTGGQSATASFDLNTAADGAFKDKALKNVKITATIEK